ncbi:SDR family oxidoreductase, partial [Hydrogenobaculum sp.]
IYYIVMAIIITGARRIGLYAAKRLLKEGKNVAVVYNSKNPCDEIDGVFCIRKDLSKDSSGVVDAVFERFGKIEAFIHMASPYYKVPIDNFSIEEYRYYNAVIVEAFLNIGVEAFKMMMKNEGHVKGRIVAFGDWAIMHTPYKDYMPYFVAKAGLHGAVLTLAKEFAPHVLVNALALGPVLKPEDMEETEWQKVIQNTPLKKEVSFEDIYSVLKLFLETTSITGAILPIDGGRHIKGVSS